MHKKIRFAHLMGCFILIASLAQAQKSSFHGQHPIGKIEPRHAREIESSNWSVGAETMGRDYTVYKYWREYLGPLGVKSARLQAGWAKTESKKGVYNWAWLDEIIPDMIDQGVKPWVCLCYGNELYEGGGSRTSSSPLPSSPEALQAWDRFVQSFVSRYKKYIDEWEIWNEPQHKKITVPDYAAFVIRTAELIRKQKPTARIFALSSAGVDIKSAKGLLDILKKEDKLYLVDSITFHPYSFNPDVKNKDIAALKKIVATFSPEISVFQGENGAPSTNATYGALSGRDWSEISQAKWLLRRMLGDLGHDIRSSYFSIINMHYTTKNHTTTFTPGGELRMNSKGLIATYENKTVHHVKKSYRGYQHLTSVFDHSLVRMPDVQPKQKVDSLAVFTYQKALKKGETGYVTTLWHYHKKPGDDFLRTPVTLTFPDVGQSKLVYVDMLNGNIFKINPKHIVRSDGKITFKYIPVGDWPVLIADRRVMHWKQGGVR